MVERKSTAPPRRRAVRLSEAAFAELNDRLVERWHADGRSTRLTVETKAELMGLSIPTTKKLLANGKVDRATLAHAFRNLGLVWSESRLACDSPPPSPPSEAPALAVVEPSPRPRRRQFIGAAAISLLAVAVMWTTAQVTTASLFRTTYSWALDYRQLHADAWDFYHKANYAMASEKLRRAEAIATEYDSADRMAFCLQLRAAIESVRGDLPAARSTILQEIEMFKRFDRGLPLMTAYEELGDVETRLGLYQDARTHLKMALAGHRRFNDKVGVALDERDMGSVALGEGNLDEADRWLRTALQHVPAKEGDPIRYDIRSRQALVMLKRGRLADARKKLLGCLSYWTRQGHPRWIAVTEMQLALAESEMGDQASATTRLNRSRAAFVRVGDLSRVAEVDRHLAMIADSNGQQNH